MSTGKARQLAAAGLVGVLGFGALAAYAVFNTVPGRILVAPVSVVVHSADALPAEVRALEASTAGLLFDRDTRSVHVAYADQRIEANLERPTEIRAIKVYGAAPYELTVTALQGGTWTAVPGLARLKLVDLAQAWNEFAVSQAVTAQNLRFELTLVSGKKKTATTSAGLAEIEIWGTGEHALLGGDALVGAMLADTPANAPLQPAQARVYAATPDSSAIGPDGHAFHFTVDRPASRFKRAWLSYEAYGLAHWVSPVRRINGHAVQGGAFTFAGSAWTPLTEPINPEWLAAGANRVDFTLPLGVSGSYSVRNVRIVGELDDGANFIARATTTVADIEKDTPSLVDGDLASAWSPYSDPRGKTGKPELTLYFDRATQLDALSIRLVNALTGTLSVELRVDGQWQTAGLPTINGNKLSAGWNSLTGFAQVPADALRINFLNGTGSPGEIREISAAGSGVNGPSAPRILVGYPDAGQFYGRKAYLRGYLSVPDNGSGKAAVTIGKETMTSADGSFGVVVSKDDVGYANQADADPWQVQIEAVYPDGQKLVEVVTLDHANDASRAHAAMPGSVNPGFAALLTAGDASLDIDPDALDKPVEIKITPLKEHELPPLDPGMTNVTPGPLRGYRFTPHGAKFKKHIKVTIPYDPALIPQGLNEQDVKTYFYDTEQGRWVVLDRYRVDNGKRKVTSLTDHFTDMINATLTVPDHPETTSYNATQMKDIKAADPGAGINLIEPPKANNMGDARLSYPIEIPPGRLGMQPQLGIQYNSSGGNGWMGLGWDLSVPAISVDTRWGVPRYSTEKETETYLLNGEMLTPVAHRGALQDRESEKRFYTRVEGAFQKIIRHGNAPRDYWWEVTDKNGVTNIYGGENNAKHDDSTLGGGQGTFRWALRRTIDTHGNTVVYHYDKPMNTGLLGGTVPGFQLYLSRIAYTGSGNTEGRYSVVFKRSANQRSDVIIDARGGFKQVTADLLKEIEVRYRKDGSGEGELVRRYELLYTEGAFKKTLLDKVVQYGADGTTQFNEHSFAYYDEARHPSGVYRGFARATDWAVGSDSVSTVSLLGNGSVSALGGNVGSGFGGGLYVGVGTVGDTQSKQVTGGLKKGFSESESETLLAMADLDGDGLPDKVFKKGNTVYFRSNRSGPNGTHAFQGAAAKTNLSELGKEKVTSTIIGGELYFGLAVFLDENESITESEIYLTDANGDGLLDLVKGGQVLFNHLDAQGIPSFSPNSALTPVAIGPSIIDHNALLADPTAIEQKRNAAYPLLDSVRRWVAPYDGTVSIKAPVRLVKDESTARANYTKADGVRVAIQRNGGELWSARIEQDDYTEHTPSRVSDVTVRKGDRLYFRVQSVFDGAYDQVEWKPEITYLGVDGSLLDSNALPEYRYRALEDYTLFGRTTTHTMPLAGTLHLGGTFAKHAATSDDVKFVIRKNGAIVHSQSLTGAQTGTFPIDLDIQVNKQDKLRWHVETDSAVDASAIQLAPTAWYTAAQGVERVQDEKGAYTLQVNPRPGMDLYPATQLVAPQQGYTVVAGDVRDDGTVTVTGRIESLVMPAGMKIPLTFTAKRQGALAGKQSFDLVGQGPDEIPVAVVSLTVPAQVGDVLYFNFFTRLPAAVAVITASSAEIVLGTQPARSAAAPVFSPAVEDLYPQPYRGWGAFGYNGNSPRDAAPIDEQLLKLSDLSADAKAEDVRAYAFVPYPQTSRWGGTDGSAWVSASEASASRLGGMKDITMPRGEQFAGGSAPPRISHSVSTGVSVGVGASEGTSESWVDFQDLNGDRFPDVIGQNGIQYTRMTGELDPQSPSGNLGLARSSTNSALNASSDGVGSIAVAIANAIGKVNPNGKGSAAGSKSMSAEPSFGVSGGGGTSDTDYDLIDINGDGLPDKVSSDGTARLNMGYFFASPEPWVSGAVNTGVTLNGGPSLGFSMDYASIAGGMSLTISDSHSDETFVDINGDGLPDKIKGNGPFSVRLNTGNGFTGWQPWNGGFDGVARDINVSLGGGANFTFGFNLTYVRLVFTPAINVTESVGRPELAFRDMDGDGYADQAYSTKDDKLSVALNPIGRTNLLKEVKRPLGASFGIEYERDGNTYEVPQSRWLMKKVSVSDGHPGDGIDTLVSTYRYENGHHDRLERDFYGYGTVVQEQRDAGAVYRAVTQEFHNDSYYTKGLVKRESTADGAGRPYLATENRYALKPVGGSVVDPTSTQATLFPALVRTERSFHEGGQGTKSTHTTFEYDAYGNVNRFTDAGDEGSADDVEALINYSVGCTDRHIVGKPLDITVIANGTVMRERSGDIDCATGNLTQLRQAIGQNGTSQAQTAQTDLTYTPDGNLASVTGAANHKGQRYALAYAYDPAVATHVVGVSDSFGYRSSAAYDYRFGKPVSTTDLNGNVISTAYDTFGRTVTIRGPYEQGSSQATLRFAYFPDAPDPYAVTEHLNVDAAGNIHAPIDTVLFTDGIKRVLQTKKRAAVNGETMMIVSGRTVFDGLGRTVAQYYPVVESLGQAGTFNAANSETYHTQTEFDVLDRTVKTTLPDATVTTMAYGFGRDRDGRNQFRTVVTDANGNSKESFRDVRELITAVKETNKGEALWTSYAYDPLKQIVQVKDVKGVLTKVEYDVLGRRTVIDNPDTGRTVTVYDPASNVVKKITANLAAAKKAITYDYDYNRLAAIHYPINAANDVTYEYGAADRLGNGSNQVGRLVKVVDASGSQELHYGKLGETVKEIRTIASHTQGQSRNSPEVYTTQYRYDSFGRLLELVLPDTETVTHVYDAGGSLLSFAGEKSGTKVAYLNLVHYDKFEQRTRLVLGNGIETKYSYDPASRRLDTLTSAGARAGTFQNLHYGYDNVGNILKLHNQVDVPPPTTFGGPNKQQFGYDDLYRLTTAQGEYKSAPDKVRNYTLALTYDTNHNILAKTQSDVITVAGGSAIPQKGTSYDWQYDYAGRQPHAPTHIGNRSFTYDLNGNQTGWESDVNGTRRHILWDEENRVSEIDDNGERNRYVYDAKGERTVKLTKQGETVYVNQYYVVRNRSVVSKHLFAGTGRVVSHLVMGTAPGNEGRGAPGNGHGSDKTPTVPESNGNSGNVKDNNGHAGNDKEKGNNGLHLGQLKNGKDNPGQGRERRSDTANLHAQDVYKNPTLTGEMPGQGSDNRSQQAGAKQNVRTSPLVISEGEASVELGGDTSGGESVEGVTATETFAAPVVNGQSEFIWYYHPDHLGSTGFVTDQNGELYEHVEYFPFGETWVQEKSNTQRTPYLYTGKELDEETGLYYYGARYYDPRTSVWQSADPILGEYLPVANANPAGLPGMGGAYNAPNLNLYGYASHNPVKFIDPDGRSAVVAEVVVIGAVIYVAAVISNPETKKQIARSLSQAGANISSGIESATEKFKNLIFNESGSDGSQNGNGASEQSPGNKIPNEELKAPPANRGKPPIGSDGEPVELHHRGQQPDSPLDELTKTDHRLGENFKKNHPNTGENASKIDRKEWGKQRQDYWKKEWDSGRFDGMKGDGNTPSE